jgi:endoglucanase
LSAKKSTFDPRAGPDFHLRLNAAWPIGTAVLRQPTLKSTQQKTKSCEAWNMRETGTRIIRLRGGPLEFKGVLFVAHFCLLLFLATTISAQQPAYSVSANHVLDSNGHVYYIHGVSRRSFEQSPSGDGHFTQTDFNNIAAWGANTVRIATNQDFLLADSSCFASSYLLGQLDPAVMAAHKAGLNVIFDLLWNDGGVPGTCATGQQKMADTRSLTFWKIMANHYKGDPRVFFELYNEPQDISWGCWLNGCTTCTLAGCNTWVGMQQMYDTVRLAGFNNLVIMGGINWARELSGVPNNLPSGSNIVYATHVHSSDPPSSWSTNFGFLTSNYPVVATEFGDDTCTSRYVTSALNYFDAPDGYAGNRMGWTGSAWNDPGNCALRSIIADWNGAPDTMGQPERDRLLGYKKPPAAPTGLMATVK